MKELLEPTLENNDEDDDSNDVGNGGGMCGSEFNEVAAMAAKSMNDDDDYSNDDGNDGSGSSGKCNDYNYDLPFGVAPEMVETLDVSGVPS